MNITDEMVNRFLSWPLPKSVCCDGCCLNRDYPNRIGTNLLTADEARQMLEHVLKDTPNPLKTEIRQTRTYAVMEIDPIAWDNIKQKLIKAGYEHAVYKDAYDKTVLDMHGIALSTNIPGPVKAPKPYPYTAVA